jgi:hypothetical protein
VCLEYGLQDAHIKGEREESRIFHQARDHQNLEVAVQLLEKDTAEIIKAQISGQLASEDPARYPQENALFPKMYVQQSS